MKRKRRSTVRPREFCLTTKSEEKLRWHQERRIWYNILRRPFIDTLLTTINQKRTNEWREFITNSFNLANGRAPRKVTVTTMTKNEYSLQIVVEKCSMMTIAKYAAEATTIINAQDYGRSTYDIAMRLNLIAIV